ncbi:polyprenyl diphosphate synthase [Chloroflexota bacterium]
MKEITTDVSEHTALYSSNTEVSVQSSGKKEIAGLPNHVAIIMDGNGRWAKQHLLPRFKGHEAGVNNIRTVIEYLIYDYGIKFVTLYGFSTENWNRPKIEVTGLLRLLKSSIEKEIQELHQKGVRLRHLGRYDGFPKSLCNTIDSAIELTKNNTRATLSFAFNYGGRGEIIDAIRRLVSEGIPSQDIDEKLFGNYLYISDLPDVDLLIRTGGELRLSNFLIWQSAYSELYFTPVLWPDFGNEDIDQALIAYSMRQRRFGSL